MNRDRTYHVVCRDCPTERIVDSETQASEVAKNHRTELQDNHQIEFARIE